jgi:hypothetical protein
MRAVPNATQMSNPVAVPCLPPLGVPVVFALSGGCIWMAYWSQP